MNESMIIIADVHGCFESLKALVPKLPKGIPICMCGDYIDRGPNSKDVVQYVIDRGFHCVRGNHEQMLLDYIEGRGYFGDFIRNGGQKTLDEYIDSPDVLKEHIKWVRGLPYYLEFPNLKNEDGRHLVVSHSHICNVWKGIQKCVKLNTLPPLESFEHIIWNRDKILKSIPDIYNIIGHTPVLEPKIKKTYANIDTGCYYKKRGYGVLTALQFPEMKVYQQEKLEEE